MHAGTTRVGAQQRNMRERLGKRIGWLVLIGLYNIIVVKAGLIPTKLFSLHFPHVFPKGHFLAFWNFWFQLIPTKIQPQAPGRPEIKPGSEGPPGHVHGEPCFDPCDSERFSEGIRRVPLILPDHLARSDPFTDRQTYHFQRSLINWSADSLCEWPRPRVTSK